MARIINALKKFSLRDLLAPIIFLTLLIPSLIFRLINKIKGRKLWLVAEEGQARDNGYHFYKYVRTNHPDDYCFYAIKKDSAGLKKVSELGNVIKWGSLKHWLYYMSANFNISSQKSGNPCPIFWYVMHVTFGLYNNRVFLQHGITKDDSKWLYYNKTKFKYFICGAKREYDYILEKFGYKKENLLLTGFPRWDNLKDTSKAQKNKSILIMPTWRKWLGGEKNSMLNNTKFYKCWNELLNSKDFIEYIEKNNIIVYFYLHINMVDYISAFKSRSKNIKVVSICEDIQEYFNKCDLLITDYSSVAFDFAYLKKPVIYYQFDIKEYRRTQLQEGYYDYEKDGFGPVVYSGHNLTQAVIDTFACEKNNGFYYNRETGFYGGESGHCSRQLYRLLCKNKEKVINKKDIKISVIIPLFNCEKYIGRCLDQLLRQDYERLEILVVDDNSSDKSLDIVKKYAMNYENIRVLQQKHSGPNEARKKGITNASGDIAIFVDADDYLVDGALDKIAEYFSIYTNVDVVRFNACRVPSCEEYNKITVNANNCIIKHEDVINMLLTTYTLNSLCLQAFRTDCLKKCKNIDRGLIYGEDLLLNLDIHVNTNNILVVNDVLYCYCDNMQSTTRKSDINSIFKKIEDRAIVGNAVMKYAMKAKKQNYSEVMYKQIKMMRDVLLDIRRINCYNKKNFINDFKKRRLIDISNEEKTLLMKYIKTLPCSERFKNSGIVNAIVNRKYDYIWSYINLYSFIYRGGR